MSRKIGHTTIPRNGLVAEYFLDGNANATVGSNGTATNMTWGTDGTIGYQKGYGIFNGTNGYISGTGIPTTYSSYSINIWFLADKVNAHQDIFTIKRVSLDIDIIELTLRDNARIRFTHTDNVSSKEIFNDNNIVSNRWYMLTAIYTGTEIKLYINGVLQSSTASTSNLLTGDGNFRIGRKYSPSLTWYFDGNILLSRLYNTTLSQQEITNLYQEGLRKLGPTNAILSGDFPLYSLPNLEQGKVLEISKPKVGSNYINQVDGSTYAATNVTDSTNGKYNVMSFNGSSSKIKTGKTINAESITIGATFKYNSYPQISNNGGLDLTTTENDDYNRISIRVDNDDNYWTFNIVGTSYSFLSLINISPKPILGKFYRVILTYDYNNNIFTAYINGIKVGQNTGIPFKLNNGLKQLKIAHGTNNSNIDFIFANVDIVDIIINNRVLSDIEIQQDYYAHKII